MVDAKGKVMKISRDELMKTLRYEPETGNFYWITRRKGRKVGKPAGWISLGYRRIAINGKEYPISHLAWLITYERWPIGDVEHKDLNRSNNKISNLREATRSQNMANGSLQSNNKSGYRGVCWRKSSKKWLAQIHVDGKKYWLGTFRDKKDAHKAYQNAAEKYFGEFARHLN